MQLGVVAGLLALASVAFAQQKVCNTKADIVFIMDGSGSIGDQNFLTQLDFIKYIVNQFPVGPNDVQFGLIKFSTFTEVEFLLNKYSKKADIINKLDRILYYGGGTKVGLALTESKAKMFTAAAGRRSGVPTIGIVMTDGRSTDSVVQPAYNLRSDYIQLFSIGIGRQASIPELNEIASKPTNQYVHMVDNFQGLKKIQDLLVQEYCKVTTAAATNTPAPTNLPTTAPPKVVCADDKVDIVFALDSSGSISLSDYNILKTFVSQIVQGFNLGPKKIRVGMLRFSDAVTDQFQLKDSASQQFVLNEIQLLQYDGAGTKTHLALRHMRTVSFTPVNGARVGVPKVAIIITDGNSNEPHLTEQEANELKKLGVLVFAIGVGNKITQDELRRMASDPKNNYLFTVSSYKDLATIQSRLNTQTCIKAGEKFTGTFPPATATTPNLGCVDVSATCNQLSADFCTDYEPWARVNCKATCKFCVGAVTQTAGPCFDLLSDCDAYGPSLCTDAKFKEFARTNCACSCKFCACAAKTTTTPKPVVTTAGPCVNIEANCELYGKGVCTDPAYQAWATANCAQFCGVCTGGATTAPPPCIDANARCADYGANVCTDPGYAPWVQQNCRKYCNKC